MTMMNWRRWHKLHHFYKHYSSKPMHDVLDKLIERQIIDHSDASLLTHLQQKRDLRLTAAVAHCKAGHPQTKSKCNNVTTCFLSRCSVYIQLVRSAGREIVEHGVIFHLGWQTQVKRCLIKQVRLGMPDLPEWWLATHLR